MQIINLKNISFNFQSDAHEKSFKIHELNLAISQGDFISILGPNGAGKSTLIKIISNIYNPSIGEASLFGKNYTEYSRKEFAKNIAYVPQNNNTQFPYSVYEIVMMGRSPYLNFWGIEDKSDQDLVFEILHKLEIYHLRNKGINEVSGGEAQRALIARALVQKPKILFLDEPNAHLDIKHQISIFNLLKNYNIDKKLTVVFISHDFNLSLRYSNRAVLMKFGKILYDGIPNEVLTKNNINEVFNVDSEIISNIENKNMYINLFPYS